MAFTEYESEELPPSVEFQEPEQEAPPEQEPGPYNRADDFYGPTAIMQSSGYVPEEEPQDIQQWRQNYIDSDVQVLGGDKYPMTWDEFQEMNRQQRLQEEMTSPTAPAGGADIIRSRYPELAENLGPISITDDPARFYDYETQDTIAGLDNIPPSMFRGEKLAGGIGFMGPSSAGQDFRGGLYDPDRDYVGMGDKGGQYVLNHELGHAADFRGAAVGVRPEFRRYNEFVEEPVAGTNLGKRYWEQRYSADPEFLAAAREGGLFDPTTYGGDYFRRQWGPYYGPAYQSAVPTEMYADAFANTALDRKFNNAAPVTPFVREQYGMGPEARFLPGSRTAELYDRYREYQERLSPNQREWLKLFDRYNDWEYDPSVKMDPRFSFGAR